jgi:hypothetical protein
MFILLVVLSENVMTADSAGVLVAGLLAMAYA